ncbi:hypothetical protein J1N35_037983 [Gossypium stocksii]|uniref:Reverse transcriptase zinc-binding domain-containing protein n=1 Tax=Gossypium stocksii TaxID=47602 RepID=A0A9D3ULS4_9ROSI|nr:hypothetical protein J1N35_037983 [Gossypium stocksii]
MEVFGANVEPAVKDLVTGILGVQLAANPEKYLDIFSTKVGTYSSFTWKSICSARELIVDGLVWRIGNGNSVNIWNDPWLPSHDQNRLSVQTINPAWVTVNHLIDTETNTWKSEIVRRLFDEGQSNRILSIPLACQDTQDMLVWKHEASGQYSVKSGYRALVTDYMLTCSNNYYNTEDYKYFYNLLWELHIPGKIKIHAWRTCSNFVPHNTNLFQR